MRSDRAKLMRSSASSLIGSTLISRPGRLRSGMGWFCMVNITSTSPSPCRRLGRSASTTRENGRS
jgi:hypothetical protein